MNIETERLTITALTPAQLDLWTWNIAALEKELGCVYRAEPMEGAFRDIVRGQAARAKKDPENFLWHSFWFIVRKVDNTVVGSIDFKNVPNREGAVEIGYGLGPSFTHQGYMTETVSAFCAWAKSQNRVKHIYAETELDNLPSQRVLERCGFTLYVKGSSLWWRL